MSPWSPDCARRPAIGCPERGVESSDARESCRERDFRHRHRGLVDQALGSLHATGRRDGARRRAGVAIEQTPQMPGRHPERAGEIFHRLAVVEEAALDEAQRTGHGRRGATPRGRSRRGLRPAAQARAESGGFGRCRSGKEDDVARLRRLHRTRRAALDPRGQHAREEPSVEPCVSRDARAVAALPVETVAIRRRGAVSDRRDDVPRSERPSVPHDRRA